MTIFRVGDTVKVHFEIIEGKTKRIQIFEGLVIAIKNEGVVHAAVKLHPQVTAELEVRVEGV